MTSRTCVTFCLLFGWSVTFATNEELAVLPGLVIADVTVVSPERTAPLERAFVRIVDGRIAQVSQRELRAETRLDGRGRFLVPGLIDSHMHVGGVPGMGAEHERRHPDLVSAYQVQQPLSYLYFGFTTVIDLFGNPDDIGEWNAQGTRPDAYFCGGTPIPNGYPMVLFPEEVRYHAAPYFLYDARRPDSLPNHIEPERHTPEAVVQRMASDGAICVKAHHEPGFGMFRDLPTPTAEAVRALVDAARAEGLPVILHANAKASQEFAVETGVDILAHGLWNGLHHDRADLTEEVIALLDLIVTDSIGYQPTFQVLHGELDLFDDAYLDDPRLADAYPEALLEWYRSDAAGWFRAQVGPGLSGPDAARIYGPILHRLGQVVAHLADGEARLLFGSDTPSAPTYANPPGLNGLMEMRRWVAAGVSEAQLFRALTLDNARAFGLDDEVGSIEVGKKAHLLLLGSNPLDGVEAYDAIDTLIFDGRPIERARLSARWVAD